MDLFVATYAVAAFIFTMLFLDVLVGLFASQRRNRSGIGWFLIAFLISPLLAFLFVAILREKDDNRLSIDVERERIDHNRMAWVFGVILFALVIAGLIANSM